MGRQALSVARERVLARAIGVEHRHILGKLGHRIPIHGIHRTGWHLTGGLQDRQPLVEVNLLPVRLVDLGNGEPAAVWMLRAGPPIPNCGAYLLLETPRERRAERAVGPALACRAIPSPPPPAPAKSMHVSTSASRPQRLCSIRCPAPRACP